MRTVRTKVYSFEELSEEAKQVAINHQRNNVETNFIYDESYKTVKAFIELFNLKEGNRSWLDANFTNVESDIQNLKGFRLQKYLWNNFGHGLFKSKYYSLWSKKDITYEFYEDGYPVLKSRYSKVFKDNSCVLTGMCYDESILQPVYEFLLKRDFSNCTINFYRLINDCFNKLEEAIESEIDYRNSDEAIEEDLLESDNEYTKSGNIFNA
jgi:hypothetical protein